jgi:hypothetical protein
MRAEANGGGVVDFYAIAGSDLIRFHGAQTRELG